MRQIVKAIKGIHLLGLVHRDIKPENILLDETLNVYLADFGFAINKNDKDFLKYSVVGTLDYYPIEMVRKERYDEKVDIWCIGILMYELLFGIAPFYS